MLLRAHFPAPLRSALLLLLGGLVVSVALARQTPSTSHTPPPDGTWTADARAEPIKVITDLKLGAVQGLVVRDGKIYAYGDVVFANPRVGVIREYSLNLVSTGRSVTLSRGGKPLMLHPTGLTWDERWGTWLGDTVMKKAVIYQLDWDRAWREGNLDNAVLAVIEDDAAVNGCRPEFVRLAGRTLLATADYGEVRPEVRLLDPEVLLKAKRTSAPGAVVHRFLAGPWNQNLHWDAKLGQLTCVQNVIEGRGWRLDTLDLAKAVADGRASGPGVRLSTLTFPSHDELEGYWKLDETHALLAVARRQDNVLHVKIERTEPKASPPATP